MKTQIAIIIFNRPAHAKSLRLSLQAEETRDLFIISDGPRDDRPEERKLVEECRRIFLDWPGEVYCNFSEQNMGCKARVTSGLDWVFEQTDRAIILEDDCQPHPDFFRYCDEMLEVYADETIVMSVCGTKGYPENFNSGVYAFSKYNNCWGWATWKRAWLLFDDQFMPYSFFKFILILKKWLRTYRAAFYWNFIMRRVLSGKINSWAYCWSISCFLNKGLHIYPPENLIVNGGFGKDSTNTTQQLGYAPLCFGTAISFPLTVPEKIQAMSELDQWIEDTIFSKSIKNRLKWFFQRSFPSR